MFNFARRLICLATLLLSLCSVRAQSATNTNATTKTSAAAKSPRRVDVNEFETLWQKKTNIVIDVRSPKEFAAGHIPGALNVDLNSPDFSEKVSKLNKERVYLVHCAGGVRSARACSKMNDLGFLHLFDLAPGFKEWEKAGKPVQK